MRRNNAAIVMIWVLVLACMLGSVLALASGRVRLVSGEAYEILERYSKIDTMRSILSEEYYQEVDDAALMNGAIDGMFAALGDPYTFYYTPEDMQRHSDNLNGSYHGVGILLQANAGGEAEIVRVYESSPAEEAGVMSGDVILAVDGAEVSAVDLQAFNEIVQRIEGEDGTSVLLRLRRGDEVLELSVVRGSVTSSNVAYSMLDGDIGYISIFQFSGDAVDGFRKAMAALQESGMRGLVIDLRNNPGGILEDVVAIADDLLPEGLIVYTEDRAGQRVEYGAKGEYSDIPLAVLVNGMSASASEILAAVVQDYGRGAIVGTQTYGKGVVQSVITFPDDGSGMQYTFSSYFTPSGKSIHKTGVTPDIVVEGEGRQSASGIPDTENDVQLRAAIQYLSTGE